MAAEAAENLSALVGSDDSDVDAHATPVADSDSDSDSDDMDIDAEGVRREFDDGRGTNDLSDERSKRRRHGMLRKAKRVKADRRLDNTKRPNK